MGKSVLVLSGSPRKGGGTDKLAAAFKEGAESAGKRVALFRTADLRIAGCLGCGHCFSADGDCALKDDMGAILAEYRKADAVVFASPVYFAGVSAQLKLAIDRANAAPSDRTSIKRCALLLTCGEASGESAGGAISMYKLALGYHKWEDAGVIVAPGLYGKDDIDGRAELERARRLGREI